MIKEQFYMFIFVTIIYAWFFADALLTGRVFLMGFWSFLLFRKLRVAYLADKWIRLNRK
ncbi:DUF3272 family protein [Pseudolactococcus reticulitermitis]|uniref:DUF3272 family protein n=1 Tax=Pseudolactococcus reticulitermitis TaxID=2025039 RepID=UPI000B9EE556